MNAFWFHYNKPLSEQRGQPTMTLHCKGACNFVRRIVCNVPTHSRERTRQPRMVIAGVGNVRISGDTAYITGDRA